MTNLLAAALVALILSAGAVSEAGQPSPQKPGAAPAPRAAGPGAGSQQASPGVMVTESRDARETRERLNDVLEQYPPSVREVLKLDPTLLRHEDYLATYPMLAGFLQQYPEVSHNPSFFIGERRFDERNNSPQMEAARALNNVVEFAGVVLIVMTITAGVIFLVRTVVEHRRWQRATKAQADLNNKLIDRFAASDELLAYLQSPQGRVLTDAPPLVQSTARAMDAPLGRIFWSLQAGAVLACGGAGLLFVSTRMQNDLLVVAPTFFAFGTVVLTVGVGFLVSSAISFLLSQRLGLVRPWPTRHSGEAPGA